MQRHLCLVLSTMTVLQGDYAVAVLLHDALTWADQAITGLWPVHMYLQHQVTAAHFTEYAVRITESASLKLYLQGQVTLSLDVLTAMAEEIDALQAFRRKAVMPVLLQMSQRVFSLLGRLMTGMHIPCTDSWKDGCLRHSAR